MGSADPQVLSQTFLRVVSASLIMKTALLCLLTVGVASSELFFSPGNEYVYTYSGKILTGIPEVDTTFAGMSITGHIIVQATRVNTFKLAIRDVGFSTFNEKLTGVEPRNWRSVDTPATAPLTASFKITKLRLGDWSIEGYGGETGNDDLPPEQDFDITEDAFKKHEGYGQVYDDNKKNTVNDIALVKLPRPAIFNEGVKPACLPFQEKEILNYLRIDDLISGLVGRQPTVIGWGKTDADQLRTFNGLGSRILQKLEKVPILSNQQCSAKGINVNLRESQVCAGGIEGQDACRGDSGSGLYIQQSVEDQNTERYLIGIVSFGSRDCGNGKPGVYTRVSSFIPWILKNLK